MHDRQPVVEKFQHGEAAEDALQDHPTDSGGAKPFDPRALVFAPENNGENDDEQAEDSGYDAMGVLKGDSADHRRGGAARGGGPIRGGGGGGLMRGEGGVFRGNESASTEEDDGPGDYEQRKFVDTRVIRRFHEFRAQSRKTDYSAPAAAMFGLPILNRGECSTRGKQEARGDLTQRALR